MVLTNTDTPGTYRAWLRMTYQNGSQGQVARGSVRFVGDTVLAQLSGGSVMGNGRMRGLQLFSGGIEFGSSAMTLVDAHYDASMCTFARVIQ